MKIMELAIMLIGSNEGDRLENLRKAVSNISMEIAEPVKCSSVYCTSAWGITDQPDFLNMVIGVNTELSAQDVLKKLLNIELKMGRTRNIKWGPRIIDLDLLYLGKHMSNESGLTLPHPGIPSRKFTLVPLCEIYPNFIHPLMGISQQQMLLNCKDTGEVKIFNQQL